MKKSIITLFAALVFVVTFSIANTQEVGPIPGGSEDVGIWIAENIGDLAKAIADNNWQTWIQNFLDPYDIWYTALFHARPSVGPDSATDDIALFLFASPNPVVRLTGVSIRGLETMGKPISSSNPGTHKQYVTLFTAMCNDLEKQFGVVAGSMQCSDYKYLLTLNNPDSNKLAIDLRIELGNYYLEQIDDGCINRATGFRYPYGCNVTQ